MAKKQNKVKEESSLQEHAIDINNLSMPELVKKIENQLVDPKMVDKAILEKVAMYFRARRGYETEDIADILQVCTRTVERYIENIRSKNSLIVGTNFQNELLGDVRRDFKLQYQRLWRLSYSDNLSDYERARIIFMCSQIRANEVALLGRLGYLSRERGLETIDDVKDDMKEL